VLPIGCLAEVAEHRVDCLPGNHAAARERSTTALPDRGTLVSIVFVRGSLRAPVTAELSQTVEAGIRRGARQVLLDLSGLVDIDAAGVGELLRAFNAVSAAGGVLQITHVQRPVRHLLQIAGLFTLLTGGGDA
jgi:anti-anti-sigma factor